MKGIATLFIIGHGCECLGMNVKAELMSFNQPQTSRFTVFLNTCISIFAYTNFFCEAWYTYVTSQALQKCGTNCAS